MMRLSREVRFAVIGTDEVKISNSWSGWPTTNLVVPRLSLVTTVEGSIDLRSSYVCNIKRIDDLVRTVLTKDVIPRFQPGTGAEAFLSHVFECSHNSWELPGVSIVEQKLLITPFLNFSIRSKDVNMVCLTQQFEFSASHRLHNDELSDKENQELFGKCNNPNGHGHNYVVEVSIHRSQAQGSINLSEFELIVKELVVDRLDHKHLNRDVEYFADVNPSVENIAIAIFHWLDGQFGLDKLVNVRVYETPKTWADYAGV